MELIRRFSADVLSQALIDWQWIPELAGKVPLVTSAFGDVFLQGDDGVWFLDTVEGNLTHEWDSPQSMREQLNTVEGQDRFLMAGLAVAAHERGVVPGENEVLSFKVAPVLGGPFDPANIEARDLIVTLSTAGHLHRQVNELPPGSEISGITVDG